MSLTPGTRLGVYEITAAIGEGGMDAVFRARDTKLDRDVAIMILPEPRVSESRYTPCVPPVTRAKMTVRRFASNAEADRHDAAYWRRMAPDERVRFAWHLSLEQWELLGRKPDEPGLCRSVARVQRG